MMFKKSCLKITSDIDLTPMIDVVFLLVIFFMVSTTFMLQPGIKITLPQTVNEEPEIVENIVITITEEGDYYLNEVFIEPEKIQIELAKIIVSDEQQTVIINADENAKHKFIVTAMDIIKSLNVQNFVIATKKAGITE